MPIYMVDVRCFIVYRLLVETAVTTGAAQSESPGPKLRLRERLRRFEPTSDRAWSRLAALVLAVASVVLVSAYLHGAPAFSPIDELQHFDYVAKAPSIPRDGEPIGSEAMNAEACRGLYYPMPLPECGVAPYDPFDFQEAGRSTAYIHPPAYYFATAAVARPLSAMTGLSLYVSARLVGVLWLFAGLWVTWLLGRRLGAPPMGLLGILLLVASTPWMWISSGNVTPDAAALLIGAGALWLTIRWDDPRRQLLAVSAAAVLSVMVKANHVIAIAPVCVYLVADAVLPNRAPSEAQRRVRADRWKWLRQRTVIALAPLFVAGVLVVGWNRVVSARAIPGTEGMTSSFPVGDLHVGDVLISWQAFFPPTAAIPWGVPIIGDHAVMRFVNMLLAATLVLACVYVVLTASFARRARIIAGSLLVSMLLGGPIYTLATVVLADQLLPQLPVRYGLALMGPLAVIAAIAITPRRMQGLVLGTGVLYVAYTVFISFHQDMRVI